MHCRSWICGAHCWFRLLLCTFSLLLLLLASPPVFYLITIIQSMSRRWGRQTSSLFCPQFPAVVFFGESLLSVSDLVRRSIGGICIFPGYPPTPPSSHPPSQRQTGRGEKEAVHRAEGQGQSHPSSSRFSPRSGQCNEFPRYPPLH